MTDRVRCMQGFAGVDYSTGARGSSGPVQFERQQEQDPFGLDKYANEVRAGRKNALDGIGSGGVALFLPALLISRFPSKHC